MLFGMSLINSFTHIQENWKFVIICVQNQWGVVHLWHDTVANLWGGDIRISQNLMKTLKNHISWTDYPILKIFTVWFLKIFCIKWIHIFFWVQCSFKYIKFLISVGILKWQIATWSTTSWSTTLLFHTITKMK